MYYREKVEMGDEVNFSQGGQLGLTEEHLKSPEKGEGVLWMYMGRALQVKGTVSVRPEGRVCLVNLRDIKGVLREGSKEEGT